MLDPTIAVAHPFQVETEEKLVAVVSSRDVDSLICCFINRSVDPETWTDLQLWSGVQGFLRRMCSLACLLLQGLWWGAGFLGRRCLRRSSRCR